MSNKFYEWWKNHRKVVTYGAFIILFGFYLSPVVKEAKYKNQCIKYSTKGALTKFNKDDIGETLLEETGLNIDELAKIEVLDIYIRVEKPSGDVFFDISKGSGSFTFENRELFYTIKEEILVDRFEKKLSLEYEKNEDFNRGVHKVVLYTKNYIIGSSEFLVK